MKVAQVLRSLNRPSSTGHISYTIQLINHVANRTYARFIAFSNANRNCSCKCFARKWDKRQWNRWRNGFEETCCGCEMNFFYGFHFQRNRWTTWWWTCPWLMMLGNFVVNIITRIISEVTPDSWPFKTDRRTLLCASFCKFHNSMHFIHKPPIESIKHLARRILSWPREGVHRFVYANRTSIFQLAAYAHQNTFGFLELSRA